MEWTGLAWLAVVGPGLLLLAGIWQRPERGLFLYGVALGFPDLAVSSGAINVRLEDGLVVLFAAQLALLPSAALTRGQRTILTWWFALAGVCLVSALTAVVRGYDHFYLYSLAKLVGCVAVLVVLPKVVDSARRLRVLTAGLMAGGVALVAQMAARLVAAGPGSIVTFQDLKTAATPASWNPNTLGQVATVLAFAAAVGVASTPGRRLAIRAYAGLGHAFAAMPLAVFSRGAVLGLAAGYAVFTTLTGRVRLLVTMAALAAAAGSYYIAQLPPGVAEATHVDVSTGEGLSGRYERWAFAAQLIAERPLLGHGFGQELGAFEQGFGFALAHNSFLSAWVELGILGPLLLVGVLASYVRAARALPEGGPVAAHRAALLALVAALVVQGFGNSTLYWDKQPVIALALALAVVGVAERTPRRVPQPTAARGTPRRQWRRPLTVPPSRVPA